MTLTSESVREVDLTPAEARALTDRIKVAVEGTWLLIEQAYLSRAWAALGYTSWDVYCTREFGTARLRLPREERQEVVASLRESGLSIRAIASATGVDKNTVAADLQMSEIHTPGPEATRDSAEWRPADSGGVAAEIPTSTGHGHLPVSTKAPCEPDGEESVACPAPRVAGTDGKSYAASRPTPAPTKPRTDIPRVINGALIQIDGARRALKNLTRTQVANQNEEARRAWAANLSESIEALDGFLTTLTEGDASA